MPETLVNNEIVTLRSDVNNSEENKSVKDIANINEEPLKLTSPSTDAINYDLTKFCLKRILNNNTRNKSIALLGNFPDLSNNDKAIVIFEKQPFQDSDVATTSNVHDAENGSTKILADNKETTEDESLVRPSVFCSALNVKTEFTNNIYGSYLCIPPPELNGLKATVVYPATDKHIEKYSILQRYVINETPELYEKITLPYITSSQLSMEWVYNILEHKQEAERVVFEDPDPDKGFILLPDLKWDGQNVENLYLLAITHKRDIKSLRDLNTSHLALLRNVRTRAGEAIESRYGISPTQLRMYIHYQPSFYHLHIHINPIRNDAPGIWCEKSHMLDTVINNLELLSDYYKRATLPFVLYESTKLLELYEAKMTIRKSIKRLADDVDNENDNVGAKQKMIKKSLDDDCDKTQALTN